MSDDKTPSDPSSPPQPVGRMGLRIVEGLVRRPAPEGLTLRRIAPEPPTESAPAVTSLRFEAPQRVERVPRLYETLRVVDLARFRQSLRRHKAVLAKKGSDYADAAPARARLLELLESQYRGPTTRWPDVVVIRRPATGVIETNFAILGETIYLGAHLSADWSEGRESDRFYDTLGEALLEQVRVSQSQFEPVLRKRLDESSTES